MTLLLRSSLKNVLQQSYRFYAGPTMRTIDVHALHQEPAETKLDRPFRTKINDPVAKRKKKISFESKRFFFQLLHSEKDIGLFYTVDNDDLKRISPFGKSLPLQFREEVKTRRKLLSVFLFNKNFISFSAKRLMKQQ